MKLTNPDAWHTFGGGTCAASYKNSHKAITTIGDYSISPVSSQHNTEIHCGYQVTFHNVLGKLSGGLNQNLTNCLVNLQTARRLCSEHCEMNAGRICSGQTVST